MHYKERQMNHDFLVITQYNIAAMHKIFLIEHDMDITNFPDRRYLSSPLQNSATRGDKHANIFQP